MAYSKAYQTVTAGRVREDEALAFFGQNKLAVSSGVRRQTALGNDKEPNIQKDALHDVNVGKATSRGYGLLTYKPHGYNTGS